MNAIFAVNALNGFGTGLDMPWPKSNVDLKRFKEITTGHTVIMGSGTWNSNMPKPLSNRRNIVLSHTLQDPRCEVFHNITDMTMNILQSEKVFVIGGAKTLWMLRNFIDNVYLTRFNSTQKCEITLDTEMYLQDFSKKHEEIFEDHKFEIYKRIV